MNFDRARHTLEATRDFARGELTKKAGEALSKREIDRLDDDGVVNLVSVAAVAKPVGLDTQAAKAANDAEEKATKDVAATDRDGVVDLPPVDGTAAASTGKATRAK